MESRNLAIAAIVLIVGAIIINNVYEVALFTGISLCDEQENCLINPADLVFVSKGSDRNQLQLGDILCTTDKICHILTVKQVNGFCTEGINPHSINKCYTYNQLEGEVIWRIPEVTWKVIFVISIPIVVLGLFQLTNKNGKK